MRQRTATLALLIVVASSLSAVAREVPASTKPSARHGFRLDGSAWLWPAQAKELSAQERDGVYRRPLQGELAFTWSLDRGQGDLEFVSGESRMDPSLVTEEVRVRATFSDGKTQDFPTRVVLGRDRNWAWGAVRVADGMEVEAILPADIGMARLQLIDHKGMLAWEADLKERLFQKPGRRREPEPGKDYVPSAAFSPDLKADHPGEGKVNPKVEARRELQNAYIKAGIYPPYQVVLQQGPSGR